jgi:hypothetical protein
VDEIGLSEAVRAVRNELEQVRRDGASEDIRFLVGPVEMEFEVAVAREGGIDGKVKVWVVEVGASATLEKTTTHRISMTLNPHTDREPLEVSEELRRPAR